MYTEIQEEQRRRLKQYAQIAQIEKVWCEDHDEAEVMAAHPHDSPYDGIADAIGFLDAHAGHDTRMIIRNRNDELEAVPEEIGTGD
jgi:hypothetical protein